MIWLSLVTPVYSGESYLQSLVTEVEKLKDELVAKGAPFGISELILVDDNAIDGSPALVDELAARYPWIVALHLSRNYGQHGATVAGILHSSGDWIVTLDEDLQHHPSRIPDMLQIAVRSNLDVVYGKGANVHANKLRDWGSHLAKMAVQRISGNKDVLNFSSFRLIRGPVARASASVCGFDTYFDVAVTWFTQRNVAVPMALEDQRFRTSQKSGYSLKRLMSHARRLLLSSGIKLLRLGAVVGLLSVAAGVIFGTYVLLHEVFAPGSFVTRGWASQMVAIAFGGGIVVFQLSIVLEYLALLIAYKQGRPTFFTIDRSSDKTVARYFEA